MNGFDRGDVCQLAQLWLPLSLRQPNQQHSKIKSEFKLSGGEAAALLSTNSISLATIAVKY